LIGSLEAVSEFAAPKGACNVLHPKVSWVINGQLLARIFSVINAVVSTGKHVVVGQRLAKEPPISVRSHWRRVWPLAGAAVAYLTQKGVVERRVKTGLRSDLNLVD